MMKISRPLMTAATFLIFAFTGFIFVNCGSPQSGTQTPTSQTSAATSTPTPVAASGTDFKKAILTLVQGTYGTDCLRYTENTSVAPSLGSPIHLSPAGPVAWAGLSVDAANERSSEFTLLVTHPGSQVNLRIDLQNPINNRRNYLFVLGTTTDASATTTIATDARTSPPVSDACKRESATGASGADLWSVANQFISISKTGLNCVSTRSGTSAKADFLFSPTEIKLGTNRLQASAARTSESWQVTDSAPFIGLTFLITATTREQVSVRVRNDLSFDSATWTSPEGYLYSCRP